jgi:hypothetical protein
MISIASAPIDTGSEDKVRTELTGGTEELINVAPPVANVNATSRRTQQLGRLAKFLKPANALLLSDRNTGRIDVLLSALVPLNSSRVQNFAADNPSGNPSWVTARLECISIPHTVCYCGRLTVSM